MILRHFFNARLAQSSYLVGCATTGEAVVIDPNLDTDFYIESAAQERLNITAVTETHIHADFVSGSRDLARQTRSALFLSGEGGPDWQYGGEETFLRLKEGDEILVGNVRLTARHTPGHSPEHLMFLLTDTAVCRQPFGAFTGDFLFAGDVGRPDLLEKAAGQKGSMEQSARDLYRSLARIGDLSNGLLVFPGHGAGSACGKSLGGVPVTTLGYERLTNWAFQTANESAFIQEVLQGQPDTPPYFARMKQINKTGAAATRAQRMARLNGQCVRQQSEEGGWIVDLRPSALFEMGHLPGAVSLPLNQSFITWAGTVLPYDIPLTLFAANADQARQAARDLRLIGINRVAGWVGPESLDTGDVVTLPHFAPCDLDALQDAKAVIVDVRREGEWQAGHIPDARHIPLSRLTAGANDLPRDTPLVVHCQGGTRSPIAASILMRMGFKDVSNLHGGFEAYLESGRPVHKDGV